MRGGEPSASATEQPAWSPGPPRPVLGEGAVHVWRADLATVADDVIALLCEAERERAARMLAERHGLLWSRSRGVLRALLGRYLQRDPRELRFAAGAHGKPELADGRAADRAESGERSPPRFNMSHSGSLAVYAFSRAGAVGVDVEVERRAVDEVAIAARVFGAAQARRLERLDAGARQHEFRRAWVRHEAAVKCLGVGIFDAETLSAARAPWLAELQLEADAAAAVAAEHTPRELHRWEWRG